MTIKSGKFLLLAAAAALAAGCQQGDNANEAGNSAGGGSGAEAQTGAQGGTIGQALGQSADHSSFANAVKTAGLEGALTGSQPNTLFAPTNAAFQKLPAGAAEQLMQPARKAELTALVTSHIVPGVVTAKDLGEAIRKGGGKAQIATLSGGTLTATESGGAITITGGDGVQARVTPSDQAHSNGVVHSIDTILTPAAPTPRQ